MSNKLIAVGLMLVLMWPLMAGDKKSVDHYNGPTKDMTTLRSIDGIGDNMYVIGSDANYDAVLTENDAMPAFMANGVGRGTADTLAYVPADGGWNGQFIQSPGDAMLVMFKMPADGIIKGVNVPVYEWGTGTQQMTISLHKVSYPSTTDGGAYPSSAVDGAGWIGGYDMDASGHMSIQGSEYTAGGTVGICDPGDAVVAGSQDPLGTTAGTGPAGVPPMGLLWPDGITSAVMSPTSHPAQADNWIGTEDFGTMPELMQGDWVGVLFESTGAGGGDDPTTGFYYEAGDGVVDPWVFAKFYVGCGGTSGNGGWHIRHWMVNAQLAVELTGDRGPVFQSMTALPTTISNDPRPFETNVTDDNPSGEPPDPGVATVTVSYQIDSLTATLNSMDLTMTAGTAEDGTWSGEFPGQEAGTMVYYSLTAYDAGGMSASTAMASYFVFAPTKDALVFDNGGALYGNPLYAPYLYWGWGLNPFDYWSRDYGNITSDLVTNYDVIWERADEGPDFNTDDVINPWYGSGTKTYVAGGDEWLGVRYGWPSAPMEMAVGSLAYRLGVGTYHPDINGSSTAISRFVPNADDPLGAVMADYLDSNVVTMTVDSTSADTSAWDTSYTYASSNLFYDPQYDPGHSNWLDGITAHAGGHTPYSAYYGGIDSLGNHAADAEMAPVAVYAQAGNGSKGGLIAFDQMSLYARVHNDTGGVTYSHWIGPEDYYGDSPGGLVKGMLDWASDIGASIDNEVVSTPDRFSLKGNYPNPFNPSTNIMFTLGMASDVTVKVYSILGEEIATLHNGNMIPGTHSLRWNGLTNNGFNVASGVYFYQVDVAGQVKTGKMMLMK